MAKNLWGIIRAILYMAKKDIKKTIPWFQLHMMLKKSTKIATKAIGNCHPNDIRTTFIAPTEYEFSCSDTPFFFPKRKTNRNRYPYRYHHHSRNNHSQLTVSNVRKTFDMLNTSYTTSYEEHQMEDDRSPLTVLTFGGGQNNVRQLRVTDSPFPVDDAGGDSVQVNEAAEEFIKNFYKELKQQKVKAAVEPMSPFCYGKWGQVR